MLHLLSRPVTLTTLSPVRLFSPSRGGRFALLAAVLFAAAAAPAGAQIQPPYEPELAKALWATFRGPEVKDLRVRRHDFNVKQAQFQRGPGGTLTINGQLSHCLRGRTDDQVYYSIRITGRTVTSVNLTIYRGGVLSQFKIPEMNSRLTQVLRVGPLPARPETALALRLAWLADGSWEGAAQYLIAHIAVRFADSNQRVQATAATTVDLGGSVAPPVTTVPPTGTGPAPGPNQPSYTLGADLSATMLSRPVGEDTGFQRFRPASYDRGLRVNSVVPNAPAERTGLEPGDVLVEANGLRLESEADLDRAMAGSRGTLQLKVVNVRTGTLVAATVRLEERFTRSTNWR